MTRYTISALCVVVVLVGAGAAHADAVGPPKKGCVEGATGDSCHGGPFCAPRVCSDAADCDADEACENRQLCMGEIDCTDGWGGGGPVPAVFGDCPDGSGCDPGDICTTMRVCVPATVPPPPSDAAALPEPPPDPPTPGGIGCACDCRLARSEGSALSGVFVAVLFLAVFGWWRFRG